MVKHIWSVLCQESIINQSNNSLSLMNIFEGLNIGVKQETKKNVGINIPIQYEVVTLLKKDKKNVNEKVELKISIIDPNGLVLAEPITVPVVITKNKQNHRHIMKTVGLKITVAGEYKFIIETKQENSVKFEIVSTLPLEVTVARQK